MFKLIATFLGGAIVGCAVTVAVTAPAHDPVLVPMAPCTVLASELRAEDDQCVTWLDDEGNVVLGPLWFK